MEVGLEPGLPALQSQGQCLPKHRIVGGDPLPCGGRPGAHTYLQEQPDYLGLAIQRCLMEGRACLGLAVDLDPSSQELPVEYGGRGVQGESQG